MAINKLYTETNVAFSKSYLVSVSVGNHINKCRSKGFLQHNKRYQYAYQYACV